MTVTFWRYSWERFWTKNRTLQEGFSSGEGRSILAQDKGPQSQAPATRPQSPAVRGFPRFWNRSLRCTLRGAFAVLGEREGHKPPCGSRLFKMDVPQAISKTVTFNRSKKCFLCSGDFQRRSYIFCAAVDNGKGFLTVRKSHRCNQRRAFPGSAEIAPQ